MDKMRLDKWLWAARFYKTRKLAAEAIQGGKVHLNGQRTKPGKEIKIGSKIQIQKNGLHWEIEVAELPKQRRPAKEAIHFYMESEASKAKREQEIEMRRLARAAQPIKPEHRPNKKQRRLIHRFKQSQG